MSAEKGRYWIVGMSLDYILVGRYEWGRPAMIGKFPASHHGIYDVDAFAKAMTALIRDYVRIHAPAGCRDAVEQFERDVPELYGERVALALHRSDAMKSGGVRLPEGHVKMLVDALTGRDTVLP